MGNKHFKLSHFSRVVQLWRMLRKQVKVWPPHTFDWHTQVATVARLVSEWHARDSRAFSLATWSAKQRAAACVVLGSAFGKVRACMQASCTSVLTEPSLRSSPFLSDYARQSPPIPPTVGKDYTCSKSIVFSWLLSCALHFSRNKQATWINQV